MILFVCPRCGGQLMSIHGYKEKCQCCGTQMIETKYDNDDKSMTEEEMDSHIFEEYVKDNPLYEEEEAQRTKEYNEKSYKEYLQIQEMRKAGFIPKQQNKNTPQCPKCGSTAITAGQKGFSIITGFLGSGQTVNRCANCGYKWKPRG